MRKMTHFLVMGVALVLCAGAATTSHAYTEEEKQQAKAWLSAHGYSPDMGGASQAYQDYLNGKFDEELGITREPEPFVSEDAVSEAAEQMPKVEPAAIPGVTPGAVSRLTPVPPKQEDTDDGTGQAASAEGGQTGNGGQQDPDAGNGAVTGQKDAGDQKDGTKRDAVQTGDHGNAGAGSEKGGDAGNTSDGSGNASVSGSSVNGGNPAGNGSLTEDGNASVSGATAGAKSAAGSGTAAGVDSAAGSGAETAIDSENGVGASVGSGALEDESADSGKDSKSGSGSGEMDDPDEQEGSGDSEGNVRKSAILFGTGGAALLLGLLTAALKKRK